MTMTREVSTQAESIPPHDTEAMVAIAMANLNQALVRASAIGPDCTTGVALDHLREALRYADDGSRQLRNELAYHQQVQSQIDLIEAVTALMGEWGPGSVTTPMEIKEALVAHLDQWISEEQQ